MGASFLDPGRWLDPFDAPGVHPVFLSQGIELRSPELGVKGQDAILQAIAPLMPELQGRGGQATGCQGSFQAAGGDLVGHGLQI